jgi:outer membrane receptor protein involved in Fe transport
MLSTFVCALFATIVFAAAGTAAEPLVVLDQAGKPVPGATVRFHYAKASEPESTTTGDAAGHFVARFADAVSADIEAPGHAAQHVDLATLRGPVVLRRGLSVVGTTTVATGSQSSLHEVPLATSVLDANAVALAPAATSDRLLRELPGNDRLRSNSAFTNYGQLRASFSGAGNDRGDVLVDGVPAQDAFGGQVDWLAYPTDEIERVELLRGPGSALYGSGAVGGVLDIETFAPETRPGAVANGNAGIGVGTNDATDDNLEFRTPLGPYLAGSISAVTTRLAYFDLPPGYDSPTDHISTSDSGDTHVRARYERGATTIDGALLATSDHQDEGRDNYTFDRDMRQESFDVTQGVGAIQARFGAYVRDTSIYNLDDLFPTKPGVLRYDQRVPTDENGFFASLSAAPGPFELELILDQRRVIGESDQTGATGALQSLGTGTQLAQGVGAQASYRTRRFEALAGVRADRERYDDLAIVTETTATPAPIVHDTRVTGHDNGAISPRAALRYDLTPKLAVRVSSGGGFRSPYLNELVRSYNVAAVVMAPNPNLVPERSITSVGGLDYAFGPGRLAFDVTETRVHDAIDFVTLSPTLMMRENVDHTQTNGETLTYTQDVGPCSRLRVSGTSQNARITSGPPGTAGKQLSYVPDRSASVGLDATGPGPLSYSLDSSYIGQTYADELETEPLGAALLFGGTIRATTASGTTFEVTGDNLTAQRYLSTIDRYGPPLTVLFKVKVPLGPSGLPHRGRC